jgi:CheY-like chemotaxis protein
VRETTLAGLRVLVLEDEFLIAIDVEQLCRDLGAAEVRIARSPAEISIDARTLTIDFAVVDVDVDGKPTLEFARGLRKAAIPFFFATGYAETDALFDEFPGIPVLSKPYTVEAFARAVRTVLGARKGTQAALEPSTCAAIASGP